MMANKDNKEAEVPVEEQSEGQQETGWKGLLKAIAVISIVVLVEVVAAAVLIPSAQDAEATARRLAAAEKGQLTAPGAAANTADGRAAAAENTVEVELGRFNVTRYDPETDTTLIVDFELFGVVLQKEASQFANALEANKVRLREQVIVTMSGAETTELSDAELGLIKRRILEKTNRVLGKPLVREVLFSKFNFVER